MDSWEWRCQRMPLASPLLQATHSPCMHPYLVAGVGSCASSGGGSLHLPGGVPVSSHHLHQPQGVFWLCMQLRVSMHAMCMHLGAGRRTARACGTLRTCSLAHRFFSQALKWTVRNAAALNEGKLCCGYDCILEAGFFFPAADCTNSFSNGTRHLSRLPIRVPPFLTEFPGIRPPDNSHQKTACTGRGSHSWKSGQKIEQCCHPEHGPRNWLPLAFSCSDFTHENECVWGMPRGGACCQDCHLRCACERRSLLVRWI
jgi:hypothetical protein